MKDKMGWIFRSFLLSTILNFIDVTSTETASACYGNHEPCDFINLNCSSGSIDIRSAQYLFSNNSACDPRMSINCTRKEALGCCNPENGHSPMNFTIVNRTSLDKRCLGEKKCEYQAPWFQSSFGLSSLVKVIYDCTNKTKNDDSNDQASSPTDASTTPAAFTADADNNTIEIVISVLVVLVVAIVAVVFILYWRRKGKKEDVGFDSLPSPQENRTYFTTDKTLAPPSVHHDSEAPIENSYHTIDPDCILDQSPVSADAADPGPQDDYRMIDPNKMDYETPATHDYFILEPEGQSASEYHLTNAASDDYNTLDLKAKDVVHDPNYQRLATSNQHSEDTPPKENENYSSTIGEAIRTNEAQAKVRYESLDDDYSHLNRK